MQRIAPLLGLGAVAATFVLAALGASLPACFDQSCEGDTIQKPYGEESNEGDFIDDTTWESTALQSSWLAFPAGRTWRFRVPAWEREGRPFVSAYAYISAAATPDMVYASGQSDSWSIASGNLAEFHDVSPGKFQLSNTTCSALYVRVVVHAGPPRAADSDAGDAQSE